MVDMKKVKAVQETIAPPKRPFVLYKLQAGAGDEVITNEKVAHLIRQGCVAPAELQKMVKQGLRHALLVGMRANPSTKAQKKLEEVFKRA